MVLLLVCSSRSFWMEGAWHRNNSNTSHSRWREVDGLPIIGMPLSVCKCPAVTPTVPSANDRGKTSIQRLEAWKVFVSIRPEYLAALLVPITTKSPSWTTLLVNPVRTAVPFCGQTTWNFTGVSPKRGCGPKRVHYQQHTHQLRAIASHNSAPVAVWRSASGINPWATLDDALRSSCYGSALFLLYCFVHTHERQLLRGTKVNRTKYC